MCNQRLEIDQTLFHERYSFRIRLMVAELESNIDLAERGVHERVLLLRFAPDTDDEDGASEAAGL